MTDEIGCTRCKGGGTLRLNTWEGGRLLTCYECEGSGLKVDQDVLWEQENKQGMAEVEAERINDLVVSGFYYGGPDCA